MTWPWTMSSSLLAKCLCLGLCTCGCAGLRARPKAEYDPCDDIQLPEGPPQRPVGRHIQYLWMNRPHGLTDRIYKYLRPLAALGGYHSATVHIKGGANGARLWLEPTHSEEVAGSWGRYFNLQASGGNPWHDLVNFSDCKIVNTNKHAVDMWALFDDGSLCVNIVSEIVIWTKPNFLLKTWDLPVSGLLRRAATDFLKRYEVDKAYGSVHIRRCDRLLMNRDCTAPDQLYKRIAEATHLKTWLFFMYAEEGYRNMLRARLEPLDVKLLFEDEVVLNDVFPQDNYFTYLLGKYLTGGAQIIVDTHECRGPVPAVINGSGVYNHGIFLARSTREDQVDDAYLDAEEEYAAVCSNATRGARLLKNMTRERKRKERERTTRLEDDANLQELKRSMCQR